MARSPGFVAIVALLAMFAAGCGGSAASPGPIADAGPDATDAASPTDASTGAGGDTGTGGGMGTGGGAQGGSDAGTAIDGGTTVLPSAGCGLVGSPTGHLAAQTTIVDGVARSYDVFIPQPYSAAQPHAVIFSYHGVGGTANTNQFKLDTYSTAHGGFSINVAPQGWPAPEWDENHFVPFNLEASIEVFDQVLDHLAASYCIDLNRIFVIGHSNGGQMAFHLGCLRGDRVRAVFPLGGSCFAYGQGVCDPYHAPWNQQCSGSVMVTSVMGEDDVDRLEDEAATVAGFRERQGCSASTEPTAPSPCLRYVGCNPGEDVVSCRIPGLAHAVWKDGLDDIYGMMMSL